MENEPIPNPVLDPEATAEVKANLEEGTDHAKAAAGNIKAAATGLKDAAAAKASEYKDAAAAKASELRSSATAKATELKEKAQAHYNTAKAKTQSFQDDGEEYVRANPTKSILTALACGFVLGLTLRK